MNAVSAGNSETAPKRSKSKRDQPDIDFTKPLDKQVLESLFAPPKNPKSLLLPANRAACSNKLPEDCHYRPDSLVKLFLLPDTMVISYFYNLKRSFLLVYVTVFNLTNSVVISFSALGGKERNHLVS